MDLIKIEDKIKKIFDSFIDDNIKNQMYYYHTFEYFKDYKDLRFKYYELNDNIKDKINNLAKTYFENDRIKFEIKKTSRNNIDTTNLNLLFPKGTKGQESKYEYLTEFILYDILTKIPEVDRASIDKQLNNFLYLYIDYCFSKEPQRLIFGNYIPFEKEPTGKSEKLIEDNSDIDMYDEHMRLKKKKLYIHSDYINKIDFVFPVKDTSKEPLKQVLEISAEPDSKTSAIFYRGQSNSEWTIQSSISRDKALLDNEHNMFYEILSLRPNDFANDKSDYEKLITMQHFGLPTRLLDLTRNPLIALYFASNYHFDKDGALFIVKEDKEEIINFEDKKIKCLTDMVKTPFDAICNDCKEKEKCSIIHKSYVVKGVARNQRINNQSGDFIFVGSGKESKDYGTKEINIERIIIIDKEAKKDLLEDLKLMNIHGGIVYSDLTNMTKYLRKEYSNEHISSIKRDETETVIDSDTIKNSSTEDIIAETNETEVSESDKIETSELIYDPEEIKRYLLDKKIDEKPIDQFLTLYMDDFEKKNSKEFLNDLLKDNFRFLERKEILERIQFSV